MNKIIDKKEIKKTRNRFSKLSLILSFITFGFSYYLFSNIPRVIKASEGIPVPPMSIVLGTDLFCIIGISITILSFVKKEKSTWYKWVGGIVNVVLFLLIIGSIIFAKIM